MPVQRFGLANFEGYYAHKDASKTFTADGTQTIISAPSSGRVVVARGVLTCAGDATLELQDGDGNVIAPRIYTCDEQQTVDIEMHAPTNADQKLVKGVVTRASGSAYVYLDYFTQQEQD